MKTLLAGLRMVWDVETETVSKDLNVNYGIELPNGNLISASFEFIIIWDQRMSHPILLVLVLGIGITYI